MLKYLMVVSPRLKRMNFDEGNMIEDGKACIFKCFQQEVFFSVEYLTVVANVYCELFHGVVQVCLPKRIDHPLLRLVEVIPVKCPYFCNSNYEFHN